MPNGEVRVLAILVCDSIYRDTTGKTALIGLFGEIQAQKFPTSHPRMCVFVSTTNVSKPFEGVLEIVPPHGPVVVRSVAQIDPKVGPFGIIDIQFVLNGVPLKEHGAYLVRFYVDGALVAERPLIVTPVTTPP